MTQIAMGAVTLNDQEIEAAVRVLKSGALRQGPECAAFEEEFTERFGGTHAVCSSSGTSALHIAYMCFLQPGDEVLVPGFSFIATASMVAVAGGKPVFCDIDPDTFLIDLDDAEKRITPKTRAISPVHLYGNPSDIKKVQAFARKHDLKIVWDAAQAHGARYQGQEIGGFGDFVSYSFYPSKNMYVGEGGITTTDNADYAEQMRAFRSHGQTGFYLHTSLGLNYRMTDVEAAIGREQIKGFDEKLAVRRRNAAMLNEGLGQVPGLQLQTITPGAESAWHQYCVVINEPEFGISRDQLMAKLKEQGIGSGIHYPTGLHTQPVFVDMYGAPEPLPVIERVCETILALPVHHGLSESDVERVIEAVKKAGG